MNAESRLANGERLLFATLQQHICQTGPAVMMTMMMMMTIIMIRTFFYSRKLMRVDWAPSYYIS